jgi:PKD repeat protein
MVARGPSQVGDGSRGRRFLRLVGLPLFGALVAVLLAATSVAAAGPVYGSLPVGFTQTLYGVSNARLGGVAFAPDGSPIVSDCTYLEGSLHRFDVHSSTSQGGTALHPESVLASNAGCGLVNHPDGTLYATTSSGIANLNASTGQPIRLIGPLGNSLGLAVDPQTNHLVYPAADCRYSPSCTLLDLDPTSGVTKTLVALTPPDSQLTEGMIFDPTGNFLLLANRAPAPRLTVLDRTGHLIQHVALPSEAIGLAVSANAPIFVVTVNSDGTLTRLSFPNGDVHQAPTISPFGSGGLRGEGAQVGPDGCLYVAAEGTPFTVSSVTAQSSLVQICGGFARPPGVPTGPTASFTASKARNVALAGDGASVAAVSSFYNSSFPATNLLDGNPGTYWITVNGQPNNQWVKVQLAQSPQVISQVVLMAPAAGTGTAAPKDLQIRVSTTTSDDAAFSTVMTAQYISTSGSQTFSFAPVAARYVELFVTDNWGFSGYTEVGEFQAVTPDRQGGIVSWPYGPPAAIAAVSSEFSSSYLAQNAIDDDPNTFWASAQSQVTNQFFKVQLGGGQLYSINQVQLQGINGAGPKDFDIRVSTTTADDSAFTTVFSGTAANNSNLQVFSFPPVSATYVELFAKTGYYSGVIEVSSFQALTPDGANAARLGGVGAFVVASSGQNSSGPTFSPANAVDGDPINTSWYTLNGQTTNQWLKLLLTDGVPYLIDRVALVGTGGTDGIKDFQIRVSTTTSDDSAFTTIASGTLPEDNQTHWISLPPTSAKYVELFILDNYGLTAYVRVPDFEVYSPQRGGTSVPFVDLSSRPGGTISAWQWDFGDGTSSTAELPVHPYAAAGTYPVTLVVTDTTGLASSTSLTYLAFAPPVPTFTWSPSTPNEGQSTVFTDTTTLSLPVVSRLWQFPTATSASTTASFTFPDNGAYPVTLSVTDGNQITGSLTQSVSVLNVPPKVTLASPLYAIGSQPFTFPVTVSDPGVNDNVQCAWVFGDGTTGTGCGVIHTYPAPTTIQRSAVYTATITATDKDGGVGTATSQVIVSPGLPLTTITANVPVPIGVEYYEPTNEILLSVHYSSGLPFNFELVAADGSQSQFSNISGLTDEVYIATVRTSTCEGGFTVGESFTGTGVAGQISRIAPGGTSAQIPWVTLPGETGLLRGGLFQDRFCAFGGDLIVVTTTGNVWRVSSAGVATKIASGAVDGNFLEGVTTVPNDPTTYGPFAGKILAGNEQNGCLYAFDSQGNAQCYFQNIGWPAGLGPESPHIVPAGANFFGVDYGRQTLMGAPASALTWLVGDLFVTAENGTTWDFHWDPTSQAFQPLLLNNSVAQWEGSNFGAAGIDQVPPVPTVTPTSTSTLTSTSTATPTVTATSTPTLTASGTASETPTSTVTASDTLTATASPSATVTSTDSPTTSATATLSVTVTDTSTATASPSATTTGTATPTGTSPGTDTPTFTPSGTNTATPTNSATASPTSTATASPTGTNTATPTASPTATPTVTSTATPTNSATASPTSTSTETATTTSTRTDTASPTGTSTATPTSTSTVTLTASPSNTPTDTNTATATASATALPTATGTPTASPSPTVTATTSPTVPSTLTTTPSASLTAAPSSTPTITTTPAGVVITSANLLLYADQTNSSVQVRVHRVTAPWDEHTVTYNNFGESFDPTVMGSFTIKSSTTGWYSADVTALVQGWVNGAYPNDGLLLEQDWGSTFNRFRSSDSTGNATLRPQLAVCYSAASGSGCVTYQGPSTTPNGVPDTYLWTAQPDGNFGTDVYLYTGYLNGGDKQSLLQFNVVVPPPPTSTPTLTPTVSPTITRTATKTRTPTRTAIPTRTPTPTRTATATGSHSGLDQTANADDSADATSPSPAEISSDGAADQPAATWLGSLVGGT